jgi:hypothetical protein
MPATDKNPGWSKEQLQAPLEDGFAITPHASDELTYLTRAIWVGGAGNLDVVLLSGAEVSIDAVPAGTLLPIRVKAVRNSSTATLLVGLL